MRSLSAMDVCSVSYDEGADVTMVRLKGCVEYVTIKSLSDMFGVSKQAVENKIEELQRAYSIRELSWGEKINLVHLADFRRALFDSASSRVRRGA